jgi:hypothetical protein
MNENVIMKLTRITKEGGRRERMRERMWRMNGPFRQSKSVL